jgi:hypothetical protein
VPHVNSGLRVLALVGLFCATAACGARQRGPSTDLASTPAPTCDAFAAGGLGVAIPDRGAFRRNVGEPTGISRTPVANRHVPDQTDTLHVFTRDGLEATYYVLPRRDLLSSVAVRDPRWLRYGFPTIGTTDAAVEAAFGPPAERASGGAVPRLTYTCRQTAGPEEPVVFLLDGGQVRQVVFLYYVD